MDNIANILTNLGLYDPQRRNQQNTGRGRGQHETENRGILFDALSEGEIYGLVHGDASVYLQTTPLMDRITKDKYGVVRTTGSISSSSNTTTLTVASGALDNIDTSGTRKVRIAGAGKAGASADPDITFTTVAGDATLTASDNFFAAGMVASNYHSNTGSRITIADANNEGDGDYQGVITKYTSATSVEVYPTPNKSVSGKAGTMELSATVSSWDTANNQCTISTAALTTVTDAVVIFDPPQERADTTTTDSSPKRNFENVAYSFRTGTQQQASIGTGTSTMAGAGIPSASFIVAPNTRLEWDATFGGTASDNTYTASSLGVTNASEIDQLKLTIGMPQCMAISTKSGNEYNSWLEFVADFEYSRDGGSTYTTERVVGPANSVITTRGVDTFDDKNTTSMHDGFIIGQTKKAFVEEYVIPVEQFQPFDDFRLVVQRCNEVNKLRGHHENINEAQIKFVEAQVTDKLSYPHTAYAAVSFMAKDFSGIPARAYHIKGKKIKVPTNYLTRDELGSDQATYKRNVSSGATESSYQDWDGNFRGDESTFAAGHVNFNKVYCNNPAWIFYDIITDPRYGLGELLDTSLIDKYSLYQIARYCDELVSDGKGGTEPRFTCNVTLNKEKEAYAVLKDLATVFRGLTYWMDGQLVTIQDSPKEPVYTFTKGNVVEGMFSYVSTSEKIRPNQIKVKYTDPENFYKKRVEVVEDIDNIVEKGRIISKGKTAFGCTSQGQAHRLGKWALLTDRIENEMVQFATGVNAAGLRPGDIINVQDSDLDSVQFSGRIKAGTSTTVVTLDRDVTLAAGHTYTLHLVYPSGGAYLADESATINSTAYKRGDLVLLDEGGSAIDTQAKASNCKDDSDNPVNLHWSESTRVEKQAISTSAGTISSGSNITVSSAFSSAPNSEVIWAITGVNSTTSVEATGNALQYRILSIEETSDDTIAIGALLYNINKYDAVEKDYKIDIVKRDLLPNTVSIDDKVPSPSSVTFNLQRSAASTDSTNSLESLQGVVKASVQWETPLETAISDNLVASTYVNEALDKTETTITVGSGSSLSATGYGVIEKGTSQEEIVYWSAKSTNDLTVTRGSLRTEALAHSTGVSFNEYKSYERRYSDIQSYEIEHNFHAKKGGLSKFTQVTVPGDETSVEIADVPAGIYTVRVRTVNSEGAKSAWTTFENTVTAPPMVGVGNTTKLPLGGTISSGITISSTGNWDITSSPYTVVNGAGVEYSITQGTQSHAQRRQAFSGLTDGATGYAVFDASLTGSDPWKAIDLKTDTAFYRGTGTITGSYSWWKEVGASNSGLTLCSGTITVTQDSNTVTGSSTAFTSDFSAGDLIRLGSTNDYALNTAAWYGVVEKVNSNTELLVKGVVSKAFTGKYAYKQSWKPDFTNDIILSKVIRNSSSSYTLNNYVTGPGADGSDGSTGVSTKTIYQAAVLASKPSTPSASSGVPSGWSDSIPSLSGSELCWMSIGVRAAGGTNYTWGDVILNLLTKDNIPDFGLAKADIGLGNVPNTDMTNIGNATSGTLPANRGGTGLTSVSTLLNSNVDAEHVGLENVPNVDMRDMGNANAGTLAAARGGTGLNSVSTLLNSNTTASDVGLGNVPNVDMRDLSNATSGTLSVARGGTGLGSLATLLNTNVTTFTVDKAQVIIWSNLSDNLTPAGTTYDWTVTWLNGAGTSLGTTVIRAAVNTSNNTSLLAMTTQSNGASATVSLGGAVSAGSFQATTVTLNSVVCTLSAQIIDGSGWDFKSG